MTVDCSMALLPNDHVVWRHLSHSLVVDEETGRMGSAWVLACRSNKRGLPVLQLVSVSTEVDLVTVAPQYGIPMSFSSYFLSECFATAQTRAFPISSGPAHQDIAEPEPAFLLCFRTK